MAALNSWHGYADGRMLAVWLCVNGEAATARMARTTDGHVLCGQDAEGRMPWHSEHSYLAKAFSFLPTVPGPWHISLKKSSATRIVQDTNLSKDLVFTCLFARPTQFRSRYPCLLISTTPPSLSLGKKHQPGAVFHLHHICIKPINGRKLSCAM
jgi:hypothetical protein